MSILCTILRKLRKSTLSDNVLLKHKTQNSSKFLTFCLLNLYHLYTNDKKKSFSRIRKMAFEYVEAQSTEPAPNPYFLHNCKPEQPTDYWLILSCEVKEYRR